MKDEQKHLYNMHELSDYKVSDGYPDVRGWDVKDSDNRVIGKVDNLLVNKAAERVVYLDVEVDGSIIDAKHDPYGQSSQGEIREFLNKEGENHIIIPIGLVDLNEDSDYVYTDVIDHQTFAGTKRYRKGDTINRDYEQQVLDSYSRKKVRKDKLESSNESDANRDRTSFENEGRLREIIRDEIVKYHSNLHENEQTTNQKRRSNDVGDEGILTDDDLENRNQQKQKEWEEDDFYRRGEFDDERFRK